MKALPGQRQGQALAQIRKYERAKRLWTQVDLAHDLGVSPQQAWQLVQALRITGDLVPGEREVKVDCLRLAVSQ